MQKYPGNRKPVNMIIWNFCQMRQFSVSSLHALICCFPLTWVLCHFTPIQVWMICTSQASGIVCLSVLHLTQSYMCLNTNIQHQPSIFSPRIQTATQVFVKSNRLCAFQNVSLHIWMGAPQHLHSTAPTNMLERMVPTWEQYPLYRIKAVTKAIILHPHTHTCWLQKS